MAALAGSGPVLAAVGAMGQDLLRLDPEQPHLIQTRLLNGLHQVDWSKDKHWIGIAGNFTATGVFFVAPRRSPTPCITRSPIPTTGATPRSTSANPTSRPQPTPRTPTLGCPFNER